MDLNVELFCKMLCERSTINQQLGKFSVKLVEEGMKTFEIFQYILKHTSLNIPIFNYVQICTILLFLRTLNSFDKNDRVDFLFEFD